MKFLAFIMAFLVLVLSAMPCADKGNAIGHSKTKTELTKSTHQQNDNQQDDCSPFCHCTCCAGFSINHFIASLTIIPKYESKPTSSFLSSIVIGIGSSIWQPPQLV